MTLKDKLLSYYGLEEVPGVEANPIILGFFKNIGQEWVQSDETAWCSAFMNSCAKDLDLPYSGKLDARSWLEVGTPFLPNLTDLLYTFPDNSILVHWRVSRGDWRGHVSVPIRAELNKNRIWVLGGNQGNMVNISAYPIKGKCFTSGVLKYIQL